MLKENISILSKLQDRQDKKWESSFVDVFKWQTEETMINSKHSKISRSLHTIKRYQPLKTLTFYLFYDAYGFSRQHDKFALMFYTLSSMTVVVCSHYAILVHTYISLRLLALYIGAERGHIDLKHCWHLGAHSLDDTKSLPELLIKSLTPLFKPYIKGYLCSKDPFQWTLSNNTEHQSILVFCVCENKSVSVNW